MWKYRVAIALLCGAGFTSLVLLLIKLSSGSGIGLLLTLLMLPGSILAHLVVGSQDIGPPLFVLAANVLLYAVIFFLGLSMFGRAMSVGKMRLVASWFVLPVAMLTVLACVPALNPLWPRGLTELGAQEEALQDALPLGMGMEEARAVLRSRGIQFQEQMVTSETEVISRPDKSISAAPGDRIISARLETEASQFPCGYDIEVVLLFRRDERLNDQYVHRLRLCP